MGVRVLGVRHHSPACARLVAWAIEETRPRYVLIEGPADLNGRLSELRLPHELPVAVFTFHTAEGRTRSSWCPFCSYSPEWVALHKASEVGAEARFMDLPAWDKAFHGIENRYSDRHERRSRIVAELCRRFRVSDMDALWEHLFEQPMPRAELAERLRAYFAELRDGEPADERDGPREAFMARCVAWAAAAAGDADVVVICGGYHAPALEKAWPALAATDWPELPATDAGARVGSYLVPYSFHRLDSFTGYESGMPSPAYQQAVWSEGPAQASESLLLAAVERLRRKKQPVSAADVIAVSSMAEALRRLRGHAVVGRVDLLDGLASGLVKDGLDVPLPWTYRGKILPRTDPMLVEMVAAFSGERAGRLAPGTPQPPLLEEVRAQLDLHGLLPRATPRTVRLALTERADVGRSRVLHRLRVLAIPGFARLRGPEWATEGGLHEEWSLQELLEAQGALIEAAAYGATLESAAAARLEEALLAAEGRLAPLAGLLAEAVFVGIDSLAERILAEVGQQVGSEPSFPTLGAALAKLLGLWKHDSLLGSAGHAGLGAIVEAAFGRGLWLLEGIQGPAAPADPGQVDALLALRDTLRHGEGRLNVGRAEAHPVMQRRAVDAGAPPAIRGAALGFLWSTGFFGDAAEGERQGVLAARLSARPEVLGDFLTGLFALAREEAVRSAGLVAAIDELLAQMDEKGFLVALPSLRLAFSFFPPAEKDALARVVLSLRGGAAEDARSLTRIAVGAEVTAAGMALEADVDALARRYGLLPDA